VGVFLFLFVFFFRAEKSLVRGEATPFLTRCCHRLRLSPFRANADYPGGKKGKYTVIHEAHDSSQSAKLKAAGSWQFECI
jgi:hypothetical protein